jgi:thiol-disulfide isomerase/thioredoxin
MKNASFYKTVMTASLLLCSIFGMAQKRFIIAGHLEDLQSDTVTLYVYPDVVHQSHMLHATRIIQTERTHDGKFRFVINSLKKPFYYYITARSQGVVKKITRSSIDAPLYFIGAPGDSLGLHGRTGQVYYTGHGSDKHNFQQRFSDSASVWFRKYRLRPELNAGNYMSVTQHTSEKLMELLHVELSFLRSWKAKIEPNIYNALYANMVGVRAAGQLLLKENAESALARYYKSDTLAHNRQLISTWVAGALRAPVFQQDFKKTNLVPIQLIDYLVIRESGSGSERRSETTVEKIFSNHGNFSDELIAAYVFSNYNLFNNPAKIAARAARLIHNVGLRKAIQSIASAMSENVYTDASAIDTKGKTHHLSEYKGKVLFVDFWFNGCGGCSSFYLTSLKHVEDALIDSPDYVFISVSVDSDKSRWHEGIASGLYTSSKAINLYLDEKRQKPFLDVFKVNAYPTYAIVDRNGMIRLLTSNKLSADSLTGMLRTLSHR